MARRRKKEKEALRRFSTVRGRKTPKLRLTLPAVSTPALPMNGKALFLGAPETVRPASWQLGRFVHSSRQIWDALFFCRGTNWWTEAAVIINLGL